MLVQELRLRAFRNYPELVLRPGSGLNVLVGENGQGKSNILEAIYLLATTRSLRAGRESELIQHGEQQAWVQAEIATERSGQTLLEVTILPSDRKTVAINGSRRARVLELLGHLVVVFFGALDLGIVSGDPSHRRRFLNTEISQISPKYCFDLANYKRALEQRNRLLRDLMGMPVANSGLEAWNDQMAAYGAPIMEKRRFFVDRLTPLAAEMHHRLSGGREVLALRYLPSVPLNGCESVEEIEQAFHAKIDNVQGEERRRGTSLVGPQRDELLFSIGESEARPFGSQGQQRTAVLALKLAEQQLVRDFLQETPVLLLDDVMSDLDDVRREEMLRCVGGNGQTFITCTNLRAFPDDILREARIFQVEAGTVSEISRPS